MVLQTAAGRFRQRVLSLEDRWWEAKKRGQPMPAPFAALDNSPGGTLSHLRELGEHDCVQSGFLVRRQHACYPKLALRDKAMMREGIVHARGLNFHYLEWGTADHQPLVCLHGITQTAHSWDEVAPELARDYRVLCIDQRGHGDSDWAPDGDYSRATQAADLEAIRQALELPLFVLVGMSMGGINAITYTARHPQHVRALIIVDVSPEIEARGVQNIRQFIQQDDVLPRFEDFVARAHAFNPRRSLENIRSRLRHNLKQLPDGRWTWKYDPYLRSPGRTFQTTALLGLWEEVRAVRCPTLIVKGAESDILSPEAARRLQEAIPGSELVTIPGAGHSVMGDNPAAFVAATRAFLQRL